MRDILETVIGGAAHQSPPRQLRPDRQSLATRRVEQHAAGLPLRPWACILRSSVPPSGNSRLRELTGGLGAHSVLECVGHGKSMRTAVSIARAGGAVGRVGVPHETTIPNAQPTFYANITVAGGPAPVRAYMHELPPDVLQGRIEPGLVFDRTTNINGVPDGYRAMNEREAIKVMIEF